MPMALWAQGLFCSLLIGTIIKTLGQQLSIQYLIDIGAYAMAVSGPGYGSRHRICPEGRSHGPLLSRRRGLGGPMPRAERAARLPS